MVYGAIQSLIGSIFIVTLPVAPCKVLYCLPGLGLENGARAKLFRSSSPPVRVRTTKGKRLAMEADNRPRRSISVPEGGLLQLIFRQLSIRASKTEDNRTSQKRLRRWEFYQLSHKSFFRR